MNHRRLPRLGVLVLALVVFVAGGGCSQSTSSERQIGQTPSATSAPQIGNTPPLPLTSKDLAGWRLERWKDQPVWEFTDTRFVLTNRGKPAGAKVFEGEAGAVCFEGEWRLSQDGRTLHLSQVLADGQPGKVPDAALPVQIVGRAFINLGSLQYQRPLSYPPQQLQTKDVVGKWRLVRAGGQPPAELYIKSQEIDIAANGTWTSKVEVQPPERAADRFHGKGTWALADGMLYWTYAVQGGVVVKGSGPDSGESSVRLESGRLIVDPDFFMQARKSGTDAVAGEYER
jgi:hypothetical protein